MAAPAELTLSSSRHSVAPSLSRLNAASRVQHDWETSCVMPGYATALGGASVRKMRWADKCRRAKRTMTLGIRIALTPTAKRVGSQHQPGCGFTIFRDEPHQPWSRQTEQRVDGIFWLQFSTRTSTGGVMIVRPPESLTFAWIVYVPLGTVAVFHPPIQP